MDRIPFRAALSILLAIASASSAHALIIERVLFPAHINGENHELEAMLYRPENPGRYPLVVFSHGRNGKASPRDPNAVYGYREICEALAEGDRVVVFLVRRGYGNSASLDTELQDTAIQSGLEAAKDYKAAVEYWRAKDFVLPDNIVLMGHSQGGWSVLACTNVPMEGVVGVVNLCGGTNYALMGPGAITPAVQDHWVAGARTLGAAALVPAYWIYAENDLSISGPTARRMFDAYIEGGGEAALLMFPPYGTNGHAIVGEPSLFMNQTNAYFSAIGFGPPVPQETVPNGESSAQIVNLSTRGIVSTGENVLIAGFVIAGTAPKKLLILASGLNLARRLGMTGEVGRPHLTVTRMVAGQSATMAINNDWQVNAAEISQLISQVGAQPLSESSDPARGDAGMVLTLEPGVYTALVAPDARSGNQNGIGLIELYDVTPGNGSRLINISSRGLVETGDRQMIVGVVVAGSGRSRLMIRSVGPGLRAMGVDRVLSNPAQVLYRNANGQPMPIGSNDDWWNSANGRQIGALSPQLGAFGLGSISGDSVVLKIVEPGVFSSIVSGASSATGVVLTEIYDANSMD